MAAVTREAWRTRPAFLALLLCALLLRTFVPAGFMIGPAASGAPALILCPEATPPPADHMAQHRGHAPGHTESPCPYGALAAPALPPAPFVFTQPAMLAPAAQELTGLVALRPALAAPPPPATGPPASA